MNTNHIIMFGFACSFIMGSISGWNSRRKEVKGLNTEKTELEKRVEYMQAKVDAYRKSDD